MAGTEVKFIEYNRKKEERQAIPDPKPPTFDIKAGSSASTVVSSEEQLPPLKSENGIVWKEFERLKGREIGHAYDAILAIQPFLDQANNTEGREAIVLALRSNDIPIFELPEVRAAAIHSLAPFFEAWESEEIRKAFIEELESGKEYSLPIRAIIKVINEAAPIFDSQFAKRVIGLFVSKIGDPHYPERVLADLSPRFAVETTEHYRVLENEVINICYEENAKRKDSEAVERDKLIFKAFALTNTKHAAEKLESLAKREYTHPYNYLKLLGSEATAVFGFVGFFGAVITGALNHSFLAFSGAFMTALNMSPIFGLLPLFRTKPSDTYATIDQSASEAVRYLTVNDRGFQVAENILKSNTAKPEVLDAVKESIGNLKASSPSTYLLHHGILQSGYPEIRLRAVVEASRFDRPEVNAAINSATNDPDREVRHAAFRVIADKGGGNYRRLPV